jgi:hypothetical protein
MELDTRKTEGKADLKVQDITIEVCSILTLDSLSSHVLVAGPPEQAHDRLR